MGEIVRCVETRLVAVVCVCAGLAGCGGAAGPAEDAPTGRTPAPAAQIALSARDRELWAPGPARRAAVPALVHRDVDAQAFARQMRLLAHAGYDSVPLETFVRFVEREEVSLPARPVLLTFDGGRLESWTDTDAILRELGFNAVIFVDVGRVEEGDPEYLTWKELTRLQGSGRWDVQLQSGTGNRRIRYGPAPDDVGPFYAYRGTEEVLGGWRERVFSDITYGEEQLASHVRDYRPLAFAPPAGNYGQAGTNDERIPRLLLARLLLSFQVVFTQDRGAFASPGAANPLGRFGVTQATGEAKLRRLLASSAGSR
jgi:Polysaccharide deacetylase